jgi:hypothetical protein
VNNCDIPIPARVLLVDDERQQLELRISVLTVAGFSAFTATGSLSALTLVWKIRDLAIWRALTFSFPRARASLSFSIICHFCRQKLQELDIVEKRLPSTTIENHRHGPGGAEPSVVPSTLTATNVM